jgi:SAM-dependent methyltransferase
MFDAPEAYDEFMGRYSAQLVPQMLDLAGLRPGHTALDVGCGPGALTAGLVGLLGAAAVAAVDPSEPFVEANRRRHPGVDVRVAGAEQLPFEDDRFDAALAQLVVHFMSDPVAGIGEMRRVVRSGGVVVTCVWDLGGGRAPMSGYWRAAKEIDPSAETESQRSGGRQGHLVELLAAAGLVDVTEAELRAQIGYRDLDEWWQPYTLGVGPAGRHLASLAPPRRQAVRDRCRQLLGDGPITVSAVAWAARGVVP